MLADELQLGHPEAVAARQQLLAELAEERAQSGVAGAYLFGAPRLARFLQGNNCSVDEAAAHFRRMLQWRTLEGMEQRRLVVDGKPWSPDSVPGLRELFGFMFVRNEWVNASSWAPDGHLIWIQRDGRAQLDKIMEVPDEKLLDVMSLMCELRQHHLDSLSEKSGKLCKIWQIRDLSGLSISKVVRDGMLMGRMAKILKLVNVAYPESMHKLILLNVPSGFGLLWTALRPLLNARMRQKFIFVAGGPHDFPRELVSLAGPQALEALVLTDGRHSTGDEDEPAVVGCWCTKAPELLQLPVGSAEYAFCRITPGLAVAWNFEVFPKGATLRFSAFFVSMGKAAPLASLVKEVLPQAMVHDRVTGSHRPEAGSSGLLWLTWSNESWSQDGQVRHLRMQTTGSRAEAAELGAFQALQKLPQDNHRVQLRGCGCFPWWGCQEDDNLEPARSFASLKPTLPNQQRGRQELFTTQSPDDAVENSSPTLVASQKDIEPMLIVTFLAAMYALIVISLSISRFIA
ncbi:unnamed protein product [Polarella glacialis]|uniref:CRAL-TRIO domain-containing protein n=1 Tax=Polarella glacialis TaxID=89957 RepID=A0A813LWP6_POLGL|nr:unnamed protein product [Polarella glacialis]